MLLDALSELEPQLLQGLKQGALARAFEEISFRYQKGSGNFLQTEEEKIAYLYTRLPGTHAAIQRALIEAKKGINEPLLSCLDVGAGPGSGMWAAHLVFPSIESFTLLERDKEFMNLGKKIAKTSSVLSKAFWIQCDLEKDLTIEAYDLVLASYSLGELAEKKLMALLPKLFLSTKQALVIVEPGTPRGYQKLLLMRDVLLELGGSLWAPCPHMFTCPLPKEDWCHFSVRVARSQVHRRLKSGSLGYEDEKFCYLVFGKKARDLPKGRIIRHPIKKPGHVECTICRKEGVCSEVFSKKNKEEYKIYKKLEWGDSL